MKRAIELGALVVTAVGAIAGVAGSYIILPYRVNAVEKAQANMQAQITNEIASHEEDHVLLVRIEERVKDVQRRFDAIKP